MNHSIRRHYFNHILLKNKLKIAVLGGGSWATALIKIITENKRKVGWYIRKDINIEFIKTPPYGWTDSLMNIITTQITLAQQVSIQSSSR